MPATSTPTLLVICIGCLRTELQSNISLRKLPATFYLLLRQCILAAIQTLWANSPAFHMHYYVSALLLLLLCSSNALHPVFMRLLLALPYLGLFLQVKQHCLHNLSQQQVNCLPCLQLSSSARRLRANKKFALAVDYRLAPRCTQLHVRVPTRSVS